MEAAVRWSPHSTQGSPRFAIVDVANNRLRLCQLESSQENNTVTYKQLVQRDKLPNFTAFDWSKTHERFVGIGSASGEATLLTLDADRPQSEFNYVFPIKQKRKCNSIAFSADNLLATGLDRVRNDFCMNIYDVNIGSLQSHQEPYKKLASSEAITSIKFFTGQPNTLVAGVARQCIRVYDLRDSAGIGAAQFPTRQVHNLAIDPLDENYFCSAGPQGDPVVSVWDRRFAARSNPSTPASDGHPVGAVLELRPAVDNSQNSNIWMLRFSGTKRGCFGVLSSMGEIKIVELAQHSMKNALQVGPPNTLGGQSWTSPHYTRMTHHLQYPWYDQHHGREESSRVMAYDFMSPGSPSDGPAVLALHHTREVELLKIPTPPPHIHLTALNELAICRDALQPQFIRARKAETTVAEHLTKLQERLLTSKQPGNSSSKDKKTSLAVRFEKELSLEHLNHKAPAKGGHVIRSSHELHEENLTLGYPRVDIDLVEALRLQNIQKWRCQEGYLFKCDQNKKVVANDLWLVEMWEVIKRMEDMAKDQGMVAEGLDLSYLGVSSIWGNTLGPKHHRNRLVDISPDSMTDTAFGNAVKAIVQSKDLPAFQGVQTKFPSYRQLCLSLCGWISSKDRLRDYCKELLQNGQPYKAIVVPVFKGHKDVALDLLRYAIQQRLIQNIGLGAVIACDSVNAEQRDMCSWMAEETEDPYLKALLAYFISGDWTSVTSMIQLSLTDRVGVALKHLDDTRLTEFLKFATSETVIYGDVSGLILTGVSERAVDLFEHYITKYYDLQTAVLALSFTCPVYMNDPRYEVWKETYFMQMQTWRCFMERSRFIAAHNRLAVNREGRTLNQQPKPQIAIRCLHCNLPLARRPDGQLDVIPEPTRKASGNGAKLPPGVPPKAAAKPSPSANAGLLQTRTMRSLKATFPEIRGIVATNEKQRFSLIRAPSASSAATTTSSSAVEMPADSAPLVATDNTNLDLPDDDDPSHYLIRATQGHSIAISSEGLLTPITAEDPDLPDTVVHGTTHQAWPLILKSGV
ncbi:hypothetical protein H2199_007487 [Coniosporium tulheliwenetii]|uniref:Uncharacterized protein n=1 Tax=Coniosporium tulheliwenetii TaxID=3383036 RepID=A0ACC2YQB0_9PEZI|nr:hypothetical protein H2199_007487 [Cladosporium sp. JES 115]